MIEVNQRIKNYREFCSLMNEEIKYGNSKYAQLEEWSRFYRWHKEGNAFIIDKVYDTPLPKVDNRGGNNHGILDVFCSLSYFVYKYNFDRLGGQFGHSTAYMLYEIYGLIDEKTLRTAYMEEDKEERVGYLKYHGFNSDVFTSTVLTARGYLEKYVGNAIKHFQKEDECFTSQFYYCGVKKVKDGQNIEKQMMAHTDDIKRIQGEVAERLVHGDGFYDETTGWDFCLVKKPDFSGNWHEPYKNIHNGQLVYFINHMGEMARTYLMVNTCDVIKQQSWCKDKDFDYIQKKFYLGADTIPEKYNVSDYNTLKKNAQQIVFEHTLKDLTKSHKKNGVEMNKLLNEYDTEELKRQIKAVCKALFQVQYKTEPNVSYEEEIINNKCSFEPQKEVMPWDKQEKLDSKEQVAYDGVGFDYSIFNEMGA